MNLCMYALYVCMYVCMCTPGGNDLEEGFAGDRKDEMEKQVEIIESPRHSGYQSIGQGHPPPL